MHAALTREEHLARHGALHRSLMELVGDFQKATGRLVSVTSMADLMTWSHAQAMGADDTPHNTLREMPEHYEPGTEYGTFRPEGQVNFEEAIDLAVHAISYACEAGVPRLVLDGTLLTGFGVPGILERYEFAQRCANAAHTRIKVAFVAKAEMIHPDHFGIVVARNRGLHCAIFDSEMEALSWLLDVGT